MSAGALQNGTENRDGACPFEPDRGRFVHLPASNPKPGTAHADDILGGDFGVGVLLAIPANLVAHDQKSERNSGLMEVLSDNLSSEGQPNELA